MHIILKQRIALLIVPLILLSGCGAALFATSSAGENPTSLQVRRVNLIPENHYMPFFPRTITDQQAVQQFYNTLQALPQQDSGSIAIPCPVGSGLEYQLDFFQGRTLIQEAIYHPGGCPSILIGKSDVRVPGKSFAQSLTQTIGISAKDLFPVPLFSCNIHSLCPSPTP